MRILTFPIKLDLDESDLEGVAAQLRDEVNARLTKLSCMDHERIDGFDLHPIRTSYSVPEPTRFNYDHHYTDEGFILIVRIMDR